MTPGETKARHIAALGVDVLFLIPFDRSFAEISAEEFVDDVLAEALGVRHVVAGYNFVFGRGRGGDIGMLREAGDRNGFGVSVVSAVGGGDGAGLFVDRDPRPAACRQCMRGGDVTRSSLEVEGVVMSGDQRGRQIGFPTANVDPGDYLMPLLGVYAVWVGIVDGEKPTGGAAVVNVGRRPTFDGESVTVEVNLFDFEGDLYGRTLRVAFADFIRPEMKFDGIDAIRAQIAADCDAARSALEGIVAGAANALPDAAAGCGIERARYGYRLQEYGFPAKTEFPMWGSLPEREPGILERWEKMDLYRRQREAAAGREKFVLHDGPPYANGNLHIGHALNKILKDVINRSQQMLGRDANYVPGWDCHGLPIEWKVEEKYRSAGKNKDEVPINEFRQECREFADHWVGVQSEEFQRLGVIGDWKKPYLTMTFDAEAQIARELMKFATSGQLYRGSKPVMWSVVERTALAEAEVEYHDHESDQIWVKFPVREGEGAFTGAKIVIWTTTPWTIPGNRAISYSSRIGYGLYEVTSAPRITGCRPGEKLILADGLADSMMKFSRASKIARGWRMSPRKRWRTCCATIRSRAWLAGTISPCRCSTAIMSPTIRAPGSFIPRRATGATTSKSGWTAWARCPRAVSTPISPIRSTRTVPIRKKRPVSPASASLTTREKRATPMRPSSPPCATLAHWRRVAVWCISIRIAGAPRHR